jgi:photosystem II stability/assembly factor-like uncharacterized protein
MTDPASNIAVLSCNGGTQTTGTGRAERLFVATLKGVFTLDRGADGSWSRTHSALEDLHIACLLYEPKSGKLFAGAHWNDGLHVSDDQGRTFRPCMIGIKRPHLYTLAAQYRGEQTILFAGTEPSALYRSDDLGDTWHDLPGIWDVPETDQWKFPPPPHVAHVKHVTWHPSNLRRLFVCIEQGALLISDDDGQTWTENRAYADPDKDMFRHDNHRVLFRNDPNSYFMCGGEGIHYTDTGGQSWAQLTSRNDRIGYPDAMHVDPREDSVVFVAGPQAGPGVWPKFGTSNPTVLRSRNAGQTWEELRNGFPQDLVGNIEASGLHHYGDRIGLYLGTASGEVWESNDDGDSWRLLISGLPPIAKNGHYRYLLSPEEKHAAEEMMREVGAQYA